MERVFGEKDILLNPDDPERKYRVIPRDQRKNVHYGQRKLFLMKLFFFIRYWDISKIARPKVVYAGAAPGHSIPLLSMLMPEIEFHLYDPSKFGISASPKIRLYNALFDKEIAKTWANRDDIFFISDIRNSDYDPEGRGEITEKKNESYIVEDMFLQQEWYNTIRPVKALLKLRLPYAYKFIPKYFRYLAGYVLKQPWAPQMTSETRLVPIGYDICDYDVEKYGNQMFYFNTVIRETVKYSIPGTDFNGQDIDPPELTSSFDSTLEFSIIREYLRRQGLPEEGLESEVIKLSRLLTLELNKYRSDPVSLNILRTNAVTIAED
jgi:hypothetical protein